MKQSNLSEIINTENELLKTASKKYGEFSTHSLVAIQLLQSFIYSIEDEGWLFVSFLSHIKKHSTLAFLSTIRLHHVQTVMNLRQVLESGANAAYALANPNADDFVVSTEEGLLDVPEKLKDKRYKWLAEHYPKGSVAIKKMKKRMQSSSHSNLVDTHRTFKYKNKGSVAELQTPFFDLKNEFQTKSDLWSIANIIMGLVDLFYGINLSEKKLVVSETLVRDLQSLDKENARLKQIMMNTPNFKRADRIAKARDKRRSVKVVK